MEMIEIQDVCPVDIQKRALEELNKNEIALGSSIHSH